MDDATNPVPRQVLVPVLPDNADELAAWLSGLRGSNVQLRVPVRGDKRALAETVHRNAQDALAQHKLKRAGDFNARSEALQSIQEFLGLADAPLRIECVDISHVQGTDVVASLVVFEDGLPRKSDYRHYAIREAAGDGRSDDVASIAEVTRRRFARHVADAQAPVVEDGKARTIRLSAQPLRRRRWRAPGERRGRGARGTRGHRRRRHRAGQAARGGVGAGARPDPVIMPRNSDGLYLLQRVRDEAHRFAITYHRSKRSKRMTASALDSVRGLGEHRRKALVTHFGSVARLKDASVEEITAVPGIGVATANAVLEALGVPTIKDEVSMTGQGMTTSEKLEADRA